MLEDGFTFSAFIDFLVRVIKAIGYANIVLLAFFFFDKWQRDKSFTLSSIDKFLLTFGIIDFVLRVAHAFSGRIIATRYYFVEAILLIFPAALGITLLRKFICRKSGKNPLLVMVCLLSVITIAQLASIFKPRDHKEFIKDFAQEAKTINPQLSYIYGDFPRMNYYAGLKYKGHIPNATLLRKELKGKQELKAEMFFYATVEEKLPTDYKKVLKWKIVREQLDYKNRTITLWQGESK